MVFFTCNELVPVQRNGCGIWGQNHVELFQENKMSAGLHSRNLIVGLECVFALSTQWKSFPNCFCVGVNQDN